MSRYCDLHLHTTHSDGLYTPKELMERAEKIGLKVIAISDHDAVSGYEEAVQYFNQVELDVLPAVELSTALDSTELHILGYLIDHTNPELLKAIEKFRETRLTRGKKIVEKLNELDVDLSMDTVKRIAGDGTLGRPHIAEALVQEEFVETFNEAFARYLGYHAPAYVPKYRITPYEAIALVHQAEGVAVLAHPGTMGRDDKIPELVRAGLDGIEAIYPLHSHLQIERYKKMAGEFELIYTGGSDCHGRNQEKMRLGGITVPKECYESLLRVKEKYAS